MRQQRLLLKKDRTMIVEVPVTIRAAFEYDLDKLPSQKMWIDAADLAKICNPYEITMKMLPIDYKFELDAMPVGTQDIFRLRGCWSHNPGEIIADVATPILTQEKNIMLDKISQPITDFPTGRILDLE